MESLSAKLDLATGTEDEGFAAYPICSTDTENESEAKAELQKTTDSVVAIKKAWIWNDLKTNPSALAIYRIGGDFMEPTLKPGDLVLIDRKRSTPRDGGIYILNFGDRTTCRRLQIMKNRSIMAKSDNSLYEPIPIDLQKDKGVFVGRVIWMGRRVA